MGYGISTATATQNPLEFGAPTTINFGSGYIDAPTSQTQTPDQTATASTPGGNGGVSAGSGSGPEGTVPGMSTSELAIVAGIAGVVLLAAVFLITHKKG